MVLLSSRKIYVIGKIMHLMLTLIKFLICSRVHDVLKLYLSNQMLAVHLLEAFAVLVVRIILGLVRNYFLEVNSSHDVAFMFMLMLFECICCRHTMCTVC